MELSYEGRLNYEINKNGFKRNNDSFKKSLKKLLDGFISSSMNKDSGKNTFSFINPSVGDFLLNYLKESKSEKFRIVNSIVFYEQYWHFFHPDKSNHVSFEAEELKSFFNIFMKNIEIISFTNKNNDHSRELETLGLSISFFPDLIDNNFLLRWINAIDFKLVTYKQKEYLLKCLEFNSEFPEGSNYITQNWDKIILTLFNITEDASDFSRIVNLFENYNISIDEFMQNKNNSDFIINSINSHFEYSFEDNPDLSSFTIRTLLKESSDGNTKNAENLIEDEASQQFFDLIDSIGLSSFYDSFSDTLQIDSSSILEKIIQDNSYTNDDYDDPRLINKGYGMNYIEQISKLFEQ